MRKGNGEGGGCWHCLCSTLVGGKPGEEAPPHLSGRPHPRASGQVPTRATKTKKKRNPLPPAWKEPPHPSWLLKAPSAVAFPCHPSFQAGAAAPAISVIAPCLGTCGVARQLLHNAWLPLQGQTGALPHYSLQAHSAHTACQASPWPSSKRYPIPRPTVSITAPILQTKKPKGASESSQQVKGSFCQA